MALVCNGLERALGSQPETGLGGGGESVRSEPLDQWSVTRALALRLCRKEFLQRQEVVKQVMCLLREKKSTARVDRHTGKLKEREEEMLRHTFVAA